MTTKEAVPQKLPLPQQISAEEMDERALRFAGTALIERLGATDSDTKEIGVQALIFNLQNLMRLFDRTTYDCEIKEGIVTFNRTILDGDWETGRWNLEWSAKPNGS